MQLMIEVSALDPEYHTKATQLVIIKNLRNWSQQSDTTLNYSSTEQYELNTTLAVVYKSSYKTNNLL